MSKASGEGRFKNHLAGMDKTRLRRGHPVTGHENNFEGSQKKYLLINRTAKSIVIDNGTRILNSPAFSHLPLSEGQYQALISEFGLDAIVSSGLKVEFQIEEQTQNERVEKAKAIVESELSQAIAMEKLKGNPDVDYLKEFERVFREERLKKILEGKG